MTDKALQPVEQKSIDFYGDDLTAVLAEDGQVYVAIRHMCEALGLTTAPQTRRIKRDEILADGYKGVTVLVTPGGRQTYSMIRADLVPMWLAGLRVASVKEELRDKLSTYKKEAAKVLWEAFREGRLTADPTFSELLDSDSPAAQAYKMARAMMELARNQMLLEARIETHDMRLAEHERRLEEVEIALGDSDRYVTPDQASQISQAVKTVAMRMSKASGRNEYGGVYGELYRKFGITSYKQLPAAKFDEAMRWLNEWRESIEGDAPF